MLAHQGEALGVVQKSREVDQIGCSHDDGGSSRKPDGCLCSSYHTRCPAGTLSKPTTPEADKSLSPLIAGCPWRGRSRPTRNTGSSACVAAARHRRGGRITEGRWPSARDQSVWFGEHSAEELFGALQPLLSEHDGLGPVDRVIDQALLIEAVERIPIKPLPGAPVVVKGQKEERQHRVVDLVRVERHPPTLPVSLDLRWRSWPYAYLP